MSQIRVIEKIQMWARDLIEGIGYLDYSERLKLTLTSLHYHTI